MHADWQRQWLAWQRWRAQRIPRPGTILLLTSDSGLLCRRIPLFRMRLLIVHAELIKTRLFVGLLTCNSPISFPVMGHLWYPLNWDR